MDDHLRLVNKTLILLYLTAFVLVLQSCGKKPEESGGGGDAAYASEKSEEEISPYVTKFVKRSEDVGRATSVSGIEIGFGKLRGAAGVCSRGYGRKARVVIDPYHWSYLSDVQKEMLVDHELGHCTLRRAHKTEKENGRPTSVMYPQLGQTYDYKSHYWDYIRELFNNGANAYGEAVDRAWSFNEGQECNEINEVELEDITGFPRESQDN